MASLDENQACRGIRTKVALQRLAQVWNAFTNKGKWKNTEILQSEWVEQSLNHLVERPSTKDRDTGYGFQFWTFKEMVNGKEVAIGEAKGNGGQRIFFCKDLNILVVITAGNYNNWEIKNDSKKLFVEYILPAIE